MKRTWLSMIVSLLLPVILLAGCGGGGGGGDSASSAKAITAFGIVSPAATGTVNESAKTISVTVPYLTDKTALTATFTTTGTGVAVGGTEQVSGVTVNNFSFPVVYTVSAADGSTQNYTVTVTVAPGNAKAITSYSVPGAAGIINEDTKVIVVNLPDGTDVTALTATFTTTGALVSVGSTTQVSGVTSNNFANSTNSIVYTVTAADGTSVNYTVKVVFYTPGTLITSPTVSPITLFGQTLVTHDTGTFTEIFPGQANAWDIFYDFSLNSGGDSQFNSALWILFDDASQFAETVIPYGDLKFYGPSMGTDQGVTVVAVSNGLSTHVAPLAGGYSAFLNATSDSRLKQTLNLSSASGTITLTWKDRINIYEGNFPGYMPSYRVVIRDIDDKELETLYTYTTTETVSEATHTFDLTTTYSGKTIILSFEERSMPNIVFETPNLTLIDSVSVKDSATEYVQNGDFELGNLTGWTNNTPAEVQNMTSIAEKHDGLDVTRSFYTVPKKLWGRWVDVYENNTASAITTTVDYVTYLGSFGTGTDTSTAIIYYTPSTNNMAITAWDGAHITRDIGMVFGKADDVVYTSDTGLNASNGNDMIDFYYNITVPPGKRVALVNFIILGAYDTGLSATNTSATATEIDAEAQNIVTKFWTDSQYRAGMTQQQVDAIKNFPPN